MGTVVDSMNDALNGSDIAGHGRLLVASRRLSSPTISSGTGNLPGNFSRQRTRPYEFTNTQRCVSVHRAAGRPCAVRAILLVFRSRRFRTCHLHQCRGDRRAKVVVAERRTVRQSQARHEIGRGLRTFLQAGEQTDYLVGYLVASLVACLKMRTASEMVSSMKVMNGVLSPLAELFRMAS